MRYEPQREKRYDEITAAGKQHDPSEVIKAVLADLVHAEQAIAARDAVIRGLIDAGDAVADVDAPRFPAWEAAVAKAREALAMS